MLRLNFACRFLSFDAVFSLALLLCLLCSGVCGQESECPGRYCGRVAIRDDDAADNATSGCGSCPRGYRTGGNSSLCMECDTPLSAYQWLYLLFMASGLFAFNAFRIHFVGDDENVFTLHMSNLLEVGIAAILALLSYTPQGHVKLDTCGVEQLSDWYPIFYNPSPDFYNTVQCTSEVVYPLYSIVFVFGAYNLVLMLSARPLLVLRFHAKSNLHSLYDSMYFLPCMLLGHAIAGGLVYYAFPYFIVIASLASSAYYFADLVENSEPAYKQLSFYVITALHIVAHIFGISAFLTFFNVTTLWPLLTVSLAPVLVYLVTFHFSDPDNLSCGSR